MTQSIHVALAAHRTNPAPLHQRIDVTLTLQPDGALHIDYAIRGLNLDLRVPTPHAPAPADALWQTTCCELFAGPASAAGYREFNFSPSGQWAVYDFHDVRQRAPGHPDCPAPTLRTQRTEDLLRLEVTLPRAALPVAPALRLALSVVLEAEGGHHGYWALAHPVGKPDFHRGGFLLALDHGGLHPHR